MVKTLHREKLLRALDHARLPNLAHVDPDYLKSALDPQLDHSVPYMMAPTCLGWLGSKVAAAEPAYAMFERPDLKGRCTLLDDMREVIGAALKSLGHPLNSTDPAQLDAATEVAIRWKKNIAKFENEQYKTGLASGEFLLVQGYAGDLLQVTEENDDIVVAIPAEGAAFSCDDLCILANSPKTELAHAFINFLTDPEVAAENMEWIAYRAPNKTAYSHLSEDFRGTAALFPPEEVFAKCEPIDDLGDQLGLWTARWDRIKSA
jgi:spermidine/putrescine transport system substrate-binding protein